MKKTIRIPLIVIINGLSCLAQGIFRPVREAFEPYPGYYLCREVTLNELGYHLLNRRQITEAGTVLKPGTAEFPDSWDAFDSYAVGIKGRHVIRRE